MLMHEWRKYRERQIRKAVREARESAVGERNLEYAYWKTSTMFGYVFDLHELTTALRRYAAQNPPQCLAVGCHVVCDRAPRRSRDRL